MKISDLAIDRSTTVYVLLALILVSGTISYLTLPRESNPEIIIPNILITTIYDGVAPSDIETLVTLPIERELTGISGVKRMQSRSAESVSVIEVEFEPDVDIDTALQKVRDKVDQARRELPPAAEDPTIQEINVSEFPIMFLSLTGDISPAVLTQLAKNLEDELEAIPGVLEVEVVGGVEREIQIIVDPELAGEYGVSMADLIRLAEVENVNVPAGSMELGDGKYLVRVPGEFKSAAEIEDLICKASPDGGVVHIRDIATVRDGFKDTSTYARLNGTAAVTLTVSKRGGVNVIQLAERVRATADEFEARLLPGVAIHVTMDESEQIRDMVAELENSILSGLILVLAVIFLFLGITNAVFVALAIPVSMLIAFSMLDVMGTTLNMVVLFSLILALGMLVDNGIVVVENIYRHVQGGAPPMEAAKRGAAEVAWPITTSTATTVAAFAPMFFWPGIWGKFMVFLPQTVTIALCASLFVGLVVNPALASRLMRRRPAKTVAAARKRHPILHAYGAVLGFCLNWRLPVITSAFVLLAVIGAQFFTTAKIEFVPETEPFRAFIDIDAPEGTRLEVTDAITREVERRVDEYSGHVKFIIANVGSRGVSAFGSMGGGDSNSHLARVTLEFPKLQDATMLPSAIIAGLRDRFGDITGAKIRVEAQQEGPPVKPPVNVEISGNDFETLSALALRVAEIVRGVPDAVDVRDDYEKGKPEIRVRVDRQQALLTGLNTRFIGETIQAAINGTKAGEYREGDEEYDVVVRFPRAFREDVNKLASLTLVNLEGVAVPFSAVAELEQGAGYGVIQRINRKRTVTVSSEVQDRPGPEVLKDVQAALADFPLPAGYTIAFTGENEDLEETQAFLSRAFVIAVFLIALVLVTQFNSLLQPLIILSSVVLSLAGVFLGLYLYNMPFSVLMTGVGCISLAGVVVNNAIVLIDFINQLRAQGLATREAIIQAGMTRFRPVLLTAITTILGLVPMAQGISFDFRNWEWIVGSESSQWWGPMAVAVMFGLSFATLLTLIVVPVLYSLMASLQAGLARERT